MITKKTILIFLFLLAFSKIFSLGTLPAQGNWQWRNDNGSESGATEKASEKTEITITDFSNARVRIEVYDAIGSWGSGSNTQYYTLLYSLDSTNWVQITSDATSNAFALSSSAYFTDGDATTEILTPTRSNFLPGKIFDTTSSFSFTLNYNSATQFEYSIAPTSNVQTTTRYIFSLGYSDNINGPFTAFGNNYPTLLTDSAVPVELVSFEAAVVDNNVILNWNTATEVNNYGFDIQRNASLNQETGNNNLWETIGFVKGHGNSNSPKVYSFIDNNPPSGKVEYRLKQIDTDGIFEYSDVVAVKLENIKEYKLVQNYPNPFNPTTTIKYSLPAGREEFHNVSLKVFDILGREVATLVNERKGPGIYEIEFDASELPSGAYIYTIRSGNFVQSKKMILMK